MPFRYEQAVCKMGALFANTGPKAVLEICFKRVLIKIKLNFFHKFITVNEIWVYYYTSEMKGQLKYWTVAGKMVPIFASKKMILKSFSMSSFELKVFLSKNFVETRTSYNLKVPDLKNIFDD